MTDIAMNSVKATCSAGRRVTGNGVWPLTLKICRCHYIASTDIQVTVENAVLEPRKPRPITYTWASLHTAE